MAKTAKAVTDPRGLKRICAGCGTRFYDMNKRPITCPSCETEFTGEIKIKTRRSRSVIAAEGQVDEKTAKDAANDEDEEEDIENSDVVSLEDAEENDNDDDEDDVADADLDLDDLEDEDDLEDDDDLEGLEGDVDISTDSDKDS